MSLFESTTGETSRPITLEDLLAMQEPRPPTPRLRHVGRYLRDHAGLLVPCTEPDGIRLEGGRPVCGLCFGPLESE